MIASTTTGSNQWPSPEKVLKNQWSNIIVLFLQSVFAKGRKFLDFG